MRVVVVGTGFGARVVAPSFDATPGCSTVEVVSPRDDDAVRRALARTDVDLVSVHSPPFLHSRHVRAALAAGKAVLCDKPLTTNAVDSAVLVAEAADAGAVALCNFEFRFHRVRRLLRELVRTGALGEVEHVSWTHLSAGSRVPLRNYGWLFDRDRGGGWIGAWGSHAVDTIRWCFGEVAGVDARPRIDVAERPDEHGALHRCTAEDGLSATLVLDGGATVVIDSSFAMAAPVMPRMTVAGRDAVCEIVGDERVTLRGPDGRREQLAPGAGGTGATGGAGGPSAASARDRHADPMRRFAEVVRDAVTDGEVPPGVPTFADGCACDEVLDRMRAAPVLGRDR